MLMNFVVYILKANKKKLVLVYIARKYFHITVNLVQFSSFLLEDLHVMVMCFLANRIKWIVTFNNNKLNFIFEKQ